MRAQNRTSKAWVVWLVITLVVLAVGYKAIIDQNTREWLTHRPNDLVEIPGEPGKFQFRGVKLDSDKMPAPGFMTHTEDRRSQAMSGNKTITEDQWVGVTCLKSNMRITAKILTPGVWWQVRFDGDDRKIFDLYPRDWTSNKMLVITNSYNTQEWRILSGRQTNTTAVVGWEISPDTGIPPR